MIEAPAERLPLEDASADTVVCTLVLCTVDDVPATLAEIARVLKPGGRLLFAEHVRSDDPGARALAGPARGPLAPARPRLPLQSRHGRGDRGLAARARVRRARPAAEGGADRPPAGRRQRRQAHLRTPGGRGLLAATARK